MELKTSSKKYLDRDIRNNFSAINDTLTRLYSDSVELQLGRYVTEKDIASLEEKFKNYSFLS